MNYEKLLVWQRSHNLTLDVYKITQTFPKIELYSLTNQMRRSAYSIPANIAEGSLKTSTKERQNFMK